MIEEYIQGESLETFVSHQKSISEELIVKLGIQLCDIFTYLHHLSPYPILYQDLKPEHIILCGDQVKLLDFGIASFFTGFGKNFQLYGTSRYCAPEILRGQPVTPAADIYSLGRVLTELSDAMSCRCSRQLRCILKQTCAADPADRCQEACDLKAALLRVPLSENQQSSHLIRNIAVIGSRPGAGATHISISLVSTMNQKHIPAIYIAADGSASLLHAARVNHRLIDQSGIFIYGSFRGIPDYGDSISVSVPPDDCVAPKKEIWSYVLLPVWTITYKGRDGKVYYYSMNGQNGNICGDLPVDRPRLALTSLLIALGILVFGLLGGYFLW